MPYFTTSDGTELYYTEHGVGRPVLFSHGWPLSSDVWRLELKTFADAGYRAIAHDRRGHGRSSKPYVGHDIDSYAKDLAGLVDALDLHDLTVIGHSAAGGGEAIRYAAEYGKDRVAKLVTIGADARDMVASAENPDGAPIEVFDGLRAGLLRDYSQFWKDLAIALYGANRDGAAVSQGVLDDFWRQGLLTDLTAAHDAIKAFSETDQAAELASLDIPVLIAHGDDDQIVPVSAARFAAELTPNATLKLYSGAPHGIHGEFQRRLVRDLLEFVAA